MSSQTFKLPDRETAAARCQLLHKQAFFGRLAQLGIQPQTEKEAHALEMLGERLYQRHVSATTGQPLPAPVPADLGNGFFATVKLALDQHELSTLTGPPGFAKSASVDHDDVLPPLSPELEKAAQQAAFSLCHDPQVYGAALVQRDTLEKQAAGLSFGDEEQATEPLLPDFQFTG